MAYNPGSTTKAQRCCDPRTVIPATLMQSHIIEQGTWPKGASPSKLQKNEITDKHRAVHLCSSVVSFFCSLLADAPLGQVPCSIIWLCIRVAGITVLGSQH